MGWGGAGWWRGGGVESGGQAHPMSTDQKVHTENATASSVGIVRMKVGKLLTSSSCVDVAAYDISTTFGFDTPEIVATGMVAEEAAGPTM